MPSSAFSDLLMVVEFAYSFDEFLELEPAPPTLSEVYLAMYNGGGGKVMMDLCAQLLKAAIYDPSECSLRGTRCCKGIEGAQQGKQEVHQFEKYFPPSICNY